MAKEVENKATPAEVSQPKKYIKRAKVGIDNDDLDIHLEVGQIVPEELLAHSPWIDDPAYVDTKEE